MDNTCPCCCEDYNKSTRIPVPCEHGSCNFVCCKQCTRTYLLGTTSDPHCMQCKKAWSDGFFVRQLNYSFTSKEYKEHRRKLLLEREIAKLPERMPLAANQEKANAIKAKNDIIKQRIFELREEKAKLDNELWQNQREIYNLNNNKVSTVAKVEFVLPCSAEGCRGFLSSAYKCGLCKLYSCPKCLEIIGYERTNEQHVCNPDLVATTELIKKSTKPCPKCGERIQKSEGCDQMWCPGCQTAFSWRTGEIDTGVVHNPHYYEWQRKNNNGVAPRNPGDNPCGGMPTYPDILFLARRRFLACGDEKFNRTITKIQHIHRTIRHITHTELRNCRDKTREYTDFQQEGVDYLLKLITKEKMAATIFRKDNLRKKYISLAHINELLSQAGADLMRNIEKMLEDFNNSHPSPVCPQTAHAFSDKLNSAILECGALFEYYNQEMKEVSITYKQVVPQIKFFGKAPQDAGSKEKADCGFVYRNNYQHCRHATRIRREKMIEMNKNEDWCEIKVMSEKLTSKKHQSTNANKATNHKISA